MADTVSELLPCPFCGAGASLNIPSELVTADCADIYVSCDECEVEGQHFVVETKDRTADLWPYEQRDAITAWNTRASTQPAPAFPKEEEIEREWLRGDWFEKWQDATENADDELMATLNALLGRVEGTIRAALLQGKQP